MPRCALRWRTEKYRLGSCRRDKKKTAISQSRAGLSSVTAIGRPTTVPELADLPTETVSSLAGGGTRDAPVRLMAGPQLHPRGRLRLLLYMPALTMAIFGVGAALAGLILTVALWICMWLRDVDRRLARFEGLLEGAGLFRRADVFDVTGD